LTQTHQPAGDAPRWGDGYAMVPGWLLLRQPTPTALTVYLHLAMHGRFDHASATYEECRPSIARLAKGDPGAGYPGTGMSPATVTRALRELEVLGAVIGTAAYGADGGQRPTVYRVLFGRVAPPVTPTPPVTGDRGGYHSRLGGGVTGDRGGVSPVTDNPEPPTQNHLPTSCAATDPAPVPVEPEGQEEEETGQEPPETTQPPADSGEPESAELVASVPWPAGWRLDARTRRTLRELAARCLQAGHPPAVVAAEAAAGIPGATGPGAAVARLRALAEAPPDGVDVAAARRAAERAEREHMTRIPHPFEAGRSRGYCGPCGRYESNAVHTTRPTAATQAPAETHPDRRCPHGRRQGVCLDCRGQASPAASARPPAPRRPVEPERSGIATLGRALAELQSAPTSDTLAGRDLEHAGAAA
jgi:hypothetical protein